MYAWAICLLLLEECFKIAEEASPLPPAHSTRAHERMLCP